MKLILSGSLALCSLFLIGCASTASRLYGPNGYYAIIKGADAKAKQNDFAGAIADCDKLINTFPKDPKDGMFREPNGLALVLYDAYLTRAKAKLKNGDPQGANADNQTGELYMARSTQSVKDYLSGSQESGGFAPTVMPNPSGGQQTIQPTIQPQTHYIGSGTGTIQAGLMNSANRR